MMQQRAARGRLPLLALAGISLLAALWAGLVRIGGQWPHAGLLPAGQHGAFMVSGFLGTLISLERAVALRQNQLDSRPGTVQPRLNTRLYYLAPAPAGLGSIALLIGLPPQVGRGAITLAALGPALLFVVIYRLQPNSANATMAAGASMIALTSHGGVTALLVGGLFQNAYRERRLARATGRIAWIGHRITSSPGRR